MKLEYNTEKISKILNEVDRKRFEAEVIESAINALDMIEPVKDSMNIENGLIGSCFNRSADYLRFFRADLRVMSRDLVIVLNVAYITAQLYYALSKKDPKDPPYPSVN